MGLSAQQLAASLAALAAAEGAFARGLERYGMPEPRIAAPGYGTLLRTIISQQISVQSAQATWTRLDAALGGAGEPRSMLHASDDVLRQAGLSRQKIGYARSLAGLVASGELDLGRLPEEDEQAVAALVRVKGIGRWSAEVYLLFCEGRPDIWPAGDLAVRIAVGQILGLAQRPSEAEVRALAEPWKPHRGAAAVFAWHHYGATLEAKRKTVAL